MKNKLFILFFTVCASITQAQQYKELPAYLWLSMGEQLPILVFVENKNNKERVQLEPGCYVQTSKSLDNATSTFRFCISKEQIINGTYSIADKNKKFETKIYFENSLANKSEFYLNGHLTETMISSYKDSIMTVKNYTETMQLLAERYTYFTKQDSGKSITKKYAYNGALHYIDNEVTGRLEEFDTDGNLGKLTETNPIDSNDITITHYYNGKKKSVVKGASNWLPYYEEQYDEEGKLLQRKIRDNKIETTEHFNNGQLTEKEQWFLNESKSIVEHYKDGVLLSKEIIHNRYSLDGEITEYYNAKNMLLKTVKLREKDGIVHQDTYNARGKFLKTEKLSAITGKGEAEGSKAPPPLK